MFYGKAISGYAVVAEIDYELKDEGTGRLRRHKTTKTAEESSRSRQIPQLQYLTYANRIKEAIK